MGLGHIFLSVKDVNVTEKFYRDVLGFRISDYIIFKMGGQTVTAAFFHVNGRHHSQAIFPGNTPRRLGHFMVETKTMDDTGITLDLVLSKGVRMQQGLGKHSNDLMTSFYMVSPSGFGIEYGWGGRVVDDATWVVQRHHTANVWGHHRVQAPEASPAPTPASAATR